MAPTNDLLLNKVVCNSSTPQVYTNVYIYVYVYIIMFYPCVYLYVYSWWCQISANQRLLCPVVSQSYVLATWGVVSQYNSWTNKLPPLDTA